MHNLQNLQSAATFRDLQRAAIKHGDMLGSLGFALETLANLLGADGSEHHLDASDRAGLLHAVRALGGYAHEAGMELYEAAELSGALEQGGAR